MQPLKSLYYSKDYALFYSYFHKAIKAASDKSPPPKVYLRRLQHIVLLQQRSTISAAAVQDNQIPSWNIYAQIFFKRKTRTARRRRVVRMACNGQIENPYGITGIVFAPKKEIKLSYFDLIFSYSFDIFGV
jgi:hypothetical protein